MFDENLNLSDIKLDEMNCFETIFACVPCLLFSSITFESFGTDSETRQPAPAGTPAADTCHVLASAGLARGQ